MKNQTPIVSDWNNNNSSNNSSNNNIIDNIMPYNLYCPRTANARVVKRQHTMTVNDIEQEEIVEKQGNVSLTTTTPIRSFLLFKSSSPSIRDRMMSRARNDLDATLAQTTPPRPQRRSSVNMGNASWDQLAEANTEGNDINEEEGDEGSSHSTHSTLSLKSCTDECYQKEENNSSSNSKVGITSGGATTLDDCFLCLSESSLPFELEIHSPKHVPLSSPRSKPSSPRYPDGTRESIYKNYNNNKICINNNTAVEKEPLIIPSVGSLSNIEFFEGSNKNISNSCSSKNKYELTRMMLLANYHENKNSSVNKKININSCIKTTQQKQQQQRMIPPFQPMRQKSGEQFIPFATPTKAADLEDGWEVGSTAGPMKMPRSASLDFSPYLPKRRGSFSSKRQPEHNLNQEQNQQQQSDNEQQGCLLQASRYCNKSASCPDIHAEL